MAEITRKQMLLEFLRERQSELKICSLNYEGLVPMKNMENLFEKKRAEIDLLKELIQALDTEPVRAAIAGWQQDVMENGPSALKLDREPGTEAVMRE